MALAHTVGGASQCLCRSEREDPRANRGVKTHHDYPYIYRSRIGNRSRHNNAVTRYGNWNSPGISLRGLPTSQTPGRTGTNAPRFMGATYYKARYKQDYDVATQMDSPSFRPVSANAKP